MQPIATEAALISRTRSPEQIIAEARQIKAQFDAMGKRVRPPHSIARLLTLVDESGLSGVEFGKRTGFDKGALYCWRKGLTSSGTVWPALAGVLAERKGRALAALMNDGVEIKPVQSPPPALVASANGPELARKVVRWLDVADASHDSPEAATAASLRLGVERAAAALSEVVAPAAATTGALLAHPELVTALADALRAEAAARCLSP
jgi:hypothetical protein